MTWSSLAFSRGSSSGIRSIRPKTSDRSSVSTLMPARSNSFSLKRTVLKAVGRAPMAPIRAFFSPPMTRQMATKRARSARKLSLSGSTVCSSVRVKGMPYCFKLLQADILPQKESRRLAMVMAVGSSGKAWIRTGTFNSAQRNVLAMARSSPKLGSVTTTPAISSRWALNKSAHFWASDRLSTLPKGVSSGVRAMVLMPSSARTLSIVSRPVTHKWSGKNPRLPTMTPSVVPFSSFFILNSSVNSS